MTMKKRRDIKELNKKDNIILGYWECVKDIHKGFNKTR